MEDHFMDMAIEEALKAYDNRGKVGAIIVYDNDIISRAGSDVRTGHHAEHDAIIRVPGHFDLSDPLVRLFVTYQPCIRRSDPSRKSCAQHIADSGIVRVIYGAKDSNFNDEECEATYLSLGLHAIQISNPVIVERCKRIFDDSFHDILL